MQVIQKSNRVVSMERAPREFHRPVQTPATLSILDGPMAGSRHSVITRGSELGGASFLFRDLLSVGQSCRMEMNGKTRQCEVIRCRPLSTGKLEVAVAYR